MLVLFGFVLWERRRRQARHERPPVREKLLRPAGHSLSRQIEELWDSFSTFAIAAGGFSVAFTIMSRSAGKESTAGLLVILTVMGLCAAVCTVIAWRKYVAIKQLRLGLLGEQVMAEHLQGLWADGCRVFHDVPGDGQWNLDHVVVGPPGVYAIETKCRTKKPSRNDLRDQDAVFDGAVIQFPWCKDAEAAGQARRNAKWLAGMLSKAIGEPVSVQPVVALPGWFVTLKMVSDVKVLSGDFVANFIATEKPKLSDKVIKQIAHELEQRCRDVEF